MNPNQVKPEHRIKPFIEATNEEIELLEEKINSSLTTIKKCIKLIGEAFDEMERIKNG